MLWSIIKSHCSCHQHSSPSKHSRKYDFHNSDTTFPQCRESGFNFQLCYRCTTFSADESLSPRLSSPLANAACTACFVGHVTDLYCKVTPRQLSSTIRISWHNCFTMTLKMTVLRNWQPACDSWRVTESGGYSVHTWTLFAIVLRN